ncbi:hypothetical protein DDZ18_00355 [Marinicauda salina]|uniref:Multidrug resistance protein MdtA-like barrel-sandwich hybrid domain-containing protein n=1 Tax=Marinicauda salina TaxID=2135793 RepID=A0A2U2BVS6_9PROT|nr:efflux RND transporter periplasmic adaptor subunit [Marinicauda salina]PWE18102.1 hypothetical protein DDZ18_00355 [Marinicauda salina]
MVGEVNKNARSERGWLGWVQLAVIAAVVVVAVTITLRLSGGEDPTAVARGDGARSEAVPVRVITPQPGAHRVAVASTGTVTAKAMVTLTPQVGGRVVELSEAVQDGGTFEAGEVLFRIDPRDYEIARARARAAIADARSALSQLEAEAAIARDEWRSLYPDREINPLAAREPQLEAARARLMSAEADLFQAELNLERTALAAPFDGRVVDSRIEEGQLLVAGQNYGSIYNADAIEIVAPFPPEDVARLDGAEGRTAQLSFDDRADPVEGVVVREGASLDERSRLINLHIEADADHILRPGEFVDVAIEGPSLETSLTLPARAVSGLNTVAVVRDGRIALVEVDVRDRTREGVVVAPFDAGDGVIVTPLPEDSEGRAAEILEPAGGTGG